MNEQVASAELSRSLPAASVADLDVLSLIRTPIWVFDFERKKVVWANEPGLAIWRAESPQELYERDMESDMSASVERRLAQYREDFIRFNPSFVEHWTLFPHGEPVSMRVVFSGIRLSDGRMAMLCEATREVHDSPETIRSTDALLHTSVMITLIDPEGHPLYRNSSSRSSAPSPSQSLEQRLAHRRDYSRLRSLIRRMGEARIVAEANTVHGKRWHEITVRECRDAATGKPAMFITEVDVSELREAERRANYLAYRDPLTRLYNRTYILEEGRRLFADGMDPTRPVAVLFIDLDRFKTINDSLGHAVGDQVLLEIAGRIRALVGHDTLVGRFGGDEFVVVHRSGASRRTIETWANRLIEAMAKPMHINGYQLQATPSIGMAFGPTHGNDLETLIKNADIAMYETKAQGGNNYTWYSPLMAEKARQRLDLEMSLRRSVEADDFELHFQPRYDIASGRLVGAEALLRWNHPTLGPVPPSTFIPICEEAGLIGKVGLAAFSRAIDQQKVWQAAGHRLNIAVNVSAKEFGAERFMEDLEDLFARKNADPSDFELEITESLLLGNDEFIHDRLSALRSAGFTIAIDDFGTGYSNLAYMQNYAIDCLKIDRAFIAALPERSAIVEVIIALCRLLKLRIVAEGIETAEQLQWLKERGCDEAQGYYFARPLTPQAFEALLTGR